MRLKGFVSQASMDALNCARTDAESTYAALLRSYKTDRDKEVKAHPALSRWLTALEDRDWASATDRSLWRDLRVEGMLDRPVEQPLSPSGGTSTFTLISPQILDIAREADGTRSTYAFSRLRIVAGQLPEPVPDHLAPPDWTDTCLVDTEVFDDPHDFTGGELFEDVEKVHVTYLVGMHGREFSKKVVYIGIGSGEPYGRGPPDRPTKGRQRFYRYDLRTNNHCEHYRYVPLPRTKHENLTPALLDGLLPTGADEVLCGRCSKSSSDLCLSDPMVAEKWKLWLEKYPANSVSLERGTLEFNRDDLATGQTARTAFVASDPGAAVTYALETYWRFFPLKFHPDRLVTLYGLSGYFKVLPQFRREQYALCMLAPEVVAAVSGSPANDKTLVEALLDPSLSLKCRAYDPEGFDKCLRWLSDGVIRDLYSFGQHPLHRLEYALLTWKMLEKVGWWDEALQRSHAHTMNRIAHPLDGITANA